MRKRHKKKEYRHRLFMAVAASLGYYMLARSRGLDGDVQLNRYKQLGRTLKEYDEAHK
jgi:hypothetical protein